MIFHQNREGRSGIAAYFIGCAIRPSLTHLLPFLPVLPFSSSFLPSFTTPGGKSTPSPTVPAQGEGDRERGGRRWDEGEEEGTGRKGETRGAATGHVPVFITEGRTTRRVSICLLIFWTFREPVYKNALLCSYSTNCPWVHVEREIRR